MVPWHRACGANGRMCKEWELYATAGISSSSNFFMIPALYVAWKQGLRWEFSFGLFGVLTSSLYHLCEPLNIRVYGMNEGQWHRLDNISAIMCMANLFVYFMDNRDAAFNEFLRLIFLFWCLIQQENGPWRLENTVIPIVGALILPIVKHSFFSKTRPEFNWGNFRAGMALFVTSILFFARGLDDRTDYLRMYHSGWHFFISAASFWLWRTVSIHEKKMHITAPGKTANDMM